MSNSKIIVTALYHFVTLKNFQVLRKPLLEEMLKNNVKGTLLLASEGINGTIAGDAKGMERVLTWLKKDDRLNFYIYQFQLLILYLIT